METSPKMRISKVDFIVEPFEVSFIVFNLAQNSSLYILAKISRGRIPRKRVGICVQAVD